ncbi:MAG: site-specific integrase [Coriobacteriaceae bacterium]|nr:site-specific integrase [Coriobacteriaceae bacterium]
MASWTCNKGTGRIEVRAYAGVNRVTGKAISLSLKPSLPPDATEEDISEAMRRLDAQAAWCKGRGRGLTVGAVAEYRIERLAALGKAVSTIDAYRSYLRCYIEPFIGEAEADGVRAHDFVALYGRLVRTGGKDARPVSPNTLRKLHVFLKSAFKAAVAEGVMERNPLDAVEAPTSRRTEAMALCEDDLARLASHLSSATAALDVALLLVLHTGIRRGEAAALRVCDLDTARRVLRVSHSLARSRRGRGFELKETKGRRARAVALDATCAGALAAHLARQGEALAARGLRQNSQTPLFAREDGSHHRPDQVYAHFKEVAGSLGIDKAAGVHTLRHTHATYLLMEGIDVKTISERLGHYSPAITLEVYGHVMPGRDAAAAEAFDRRTL